MIKPARPRAYVVAVQFGDSPGSGFIACCPIIAYEPAMASAQVASMVASQSGGMDLPLVAVNVVELPAAWLRQALAEIEPEAAAPTCVGRMQPEGSA